MLRHTWIQWNTKAKQGERDFTLKRKGTRDYTRSVKKSAKKAKAEIVSNNPLPNTNETLINPRASESSGEYIEPYYFEQQEQATLPRIRQFNENNKPLRVTSLIDSLEPSSPTISVKFRNTYNDTYRTNLNPLSRTQTIDIQDSSNSEGYGTFRKGPYTIPDSNITHVCHRRFSQSEDATEL